MIGYRWRGLDWDTDFFQMPVARVEPQNGGNSIERTVAEMRSSGVQLAYLDSAIDERLDREIRTAGGIHVGGRATLVCSLAGALPDPSASAEGLSEPTESDRQAVIDLALTSGELSRFRLDPRIGRERFERLYRVWAERSLDGSIADAVLVQRVDGIIAAMITVRAQDRLGHIGLFAVDQAFRGRGIGSAALRSARQWFLEHDCRDVRVVTQAENDAALMIYLKAGFEIATRENSYHFWIPPR